MNVGQRGTEILYEVHTRGSLGRSGAGSMTGRTEFGAAPASLVSLFERHGVALAVVVGLILRVALVTVIHHWDAVPSSGDDFVYVAITRALIETGRLETHYPVGFPLFLSPFLMLGTGAFSAIRAAHVLLGLVTIVLVARIAALLYGKRAGVIAALLISVYPPLIYMTGRIMSETLFIAILMASIHQFLLADHEQTIKRSALASALFGLASLVRSNLILMVPFIPLWFLMRLGTSLRARLVNGAVCAVVIVTILILPGIYFLGSKGEFIPFATNSGQTFYGANNPLADGGWVQVEDHPELLASIPPDVRRSPVAYSKAQQALGFKWIRENPQAFLSLLPKKFANAWIPGLQSSETTSQSKLATIVLVMSYALLLLCAIAGRILVRPARRDGILLSVLVSYTVMSLVFYGNPRIGLFCAPILVVYTAGLLAQILGAAEAQLAQQRMRNQVKR
jgi:4-amino-4-deoxy-L-arabinose transferase-like glycosyltransferase